jgi:hypothetical protein
MNQSSLTLSIYNRWVWAHHLAGTLEVDAVAASRRVVVINRGSMRYVGSTVSAADGTWEIAGLPKVLAGVSLSVIAFDETGTYNAEIFDHVTAAN